MKLQAFLFCIPLLAAANPLAAPVALPEAETLATAEPNSVAAVAALRARARALRSCPVTGSKVRYRVCPKANDEECPPKGNFGPKGSKASLQCWVIGGEFKDD